MKENLHRDYNPIKVVSYLKSSTIDGVIVLLRFIKVGHLTFLEKICCHILFIPKYKDVYYWLPYKRVVDASSKYGVVGPSSRFPYASVWFEVKHDSEIYTQGLNDFTFHREAVYKSASEIRQTSTFLASELRVLTRKRVIKTLDEHVFETTKRRRFKKVGS